MNNQPPIDPIVGPLEGSAVLLDVPMARCNPTTHRYRQNTVYTIKAQGKHKSLGETLKRAHARVSQVRYKPERKQTQVYKDDELLLDTQQELFSAVAAAFHLYKGMNRTQIDDAPDYRINLHTFGQAFYNSVERKAMSINGTLDWFYQEVSSGIIGF